MIDRRTNRKRETTRTGTVLSVTLEHPGPAGKEDVAESLRNLFQELMPRIMKDGILLGHLKGAVQSGDAIYAVSVTREDALDETANPAWQDRTVLEGYIITVNLISVVPVGVTKEILLSMMNRIFSQK